jgi:hypothetical protein
MFSRRADAIHRAKPPGVTHHPRPRTAESFEIQELLIANKEGLINRFSASSVQCSPSRNGATAGCEFAFVDMCKPIENALNANHRWLAVRLSSETTARHDEGRSTNADAG